MRKNILLSAVTILLLLSCTTGNKEKPFVEGRTETFTFNSLALEKNLIKETLDQTVRVYLPGNYSSSDKSYPVIYYLAGFSGNEDEVFNAAKSAGNEQPSAIDTAIKDGTITECIVVGISGSNKLGGSFYVNSPVTGNWEDHIVDAVKEVDSRYRTIKSPSSRGIAGFSMGGYGAINVGLRNPDTFGYIYAYSPGVFGKSGFDESVWATWKQWISVLHSYGAAFVPDLTLDASPYSSIPSTLLSAEEAVEGWRDSWSTGYGDAEGKIEYYKSREIPLLGAKIDYAQNDYFTWLREGSRHFYNNFVEAGIDTKQDEIVGYNHNIDSFIVKNYLLAYFGSVFK